MFMEAEIANMTPEELDKYDESLKNYRNMYTTKDIIKDWKKEVAALSKDNAALQREVEELRRQLGIVGTAKRQRRRQTQPA